MRTEFEDMFASRPLPQRMQSHSTQQAPPRLLPKMNDDRSNKRPRTASRAGREDAGGARIDALECETRALRSEVTHLRSENAVLREQLQRLQGVHEALPVVTLMPTVDISRLNTSLMTHIVSFVGTSRDLLNVALTCKSFGWQQPATGLDWSLAEEVARQIVCSGKNDTEGVRINLTPYVRGTTTWLLILRELEHPLTFDTLLGRGIEYANERRTLVDTGYGSSSAVANNYVMGSGIHYAEFQAEGTPYIGVVRPMPNLDPDRFDNEYFGFFERSLFDKFLAARTDEWGSGNVHVCQYITYTGGMSWTNWAGEEQLVADWEGMEGYEGGDTVGMLLDLNEGTLTVYRNNRRLGVMKDGLSGSYCWFATLVLESAVAIRRGEPPRA